MKRLLLASVLFIAGAALAAAQTAAPVVPGYYSTSGCVGASPCYLPYTSTNPLPTTATLSGSVTAATTGTASAAPTPVVAGTGKPLNISTNSELFTSISIGGTIVPAGHGTAATALRVELPTDGTGAVGLNAGSAIVGKVGIDQTTPGTTNAVSATNFPTTAALGHGTAATALRVELPTDGTGIVGLGTGTANIGVTGVAQGSTTSGQSGDLVQGSVLTASPTYTTGQTSPLTLNTSGALRVIPIGTAGAPMNQGYNTVGGSNNGGLGVSGIYLATPPTLTNSQTIGIQVDTKGNLRVGTGGLSSSLNITGATNVKAAAGRVYRVILNTAGATATSIIDSTGTSVTAGNTLLTIPATATAGTVFSLEFPFQTGLSVVPGTSAVVAVSYD